MRGPPVDLAHGSGVRRRRPAFSALAVDTLALGVGEAVAVVAVVQAVPDRRGTSARRAFVVVQIDGPAVRRGCTALVTRRFAPLDQVDPGFTAHHDAVSCAGVAMVLDGVVSAATCLPVLRAGRVNPAALVRS